MTKARGPAATRLHRRAHPATHIALPCPADDESATPGGMKYESVHVWMKLAEIEPPNGQPALASIVKTEDGKTVTMSDGAGKPKTATVDGVVPVGQPLSSVHDGLLTPLVEATAQPADEKGRKVCALLCYGEARTGREGSLFGQEQSMNQGNGVSTARVMSSSASDEGLLPVVLRRMLGATRALGDFTLHCAATVLTMELLVRCASRPAHANPVRRHITPPAHPRRREHHVPPSRGAAARTSSPPPHPTPSSPRAAPSAPAAIGRSTCKTRRRT